MDVFTMINLQKLQYFCAMVEEGGIHKAARRLGLSQPPLSMALKDLEKELKCQLIFRTGKNWIVTDAGNRLYEEGRSILSRMKGLANRIIQPADDVRGNVKIGFSTSCSSMLRRILPRLAAAYPLVSCQTLFSDSERLARLVRQRSVDLAVLYLPLDGREFNITPLQPQRLMAVYSRLLPPPPEGEVSLADVCAWPLLIPRRWNGGGIYERVTHAAQTAGIEPRILCSSQDSLALMDLLECIAAVAIIPQCEAERRRNYEERYIAELSEPLIPAVVTLKNIWLTNPARKIVSMLAEDSG